VERVEEATPEAWTTVMKSPRGKVVRADYTRTVADAPRRVAWRQEVEASPFERILARAETEVALEPVGPDRTRVELLHIHRLRGLAMLGGPLLRRATGGRLDQALEGLDDIAGEDEPGSGPAPEP
jgi:hypothetical protein